MHSCKESDVVWPPPNPTDEFLLTGTDITQFRSQASPGAPSWRPTESTSISRARNLQKDGCSNNFRIESPPEDDRGVQMPVDAPALYHPVDTDFA